ncbi:glycosyltransferase family 2 protein [Micromonospora krabiensis]|uniref:Glycosyl transferase family 2 n=1 Tax=Micromonospora krabiensis TaxID=307121 RepID=A0A1C3N1U4_9ACTN|nr:glycosyltransferase family 2 protein [Micromonospora krabiensis]SBV26536.1 Glycosyl transferase family 2 [Micromonospora krabiensis]
MFDVAAMRLTLTGLAPATVVRPGPPPVRRPRVSVVVPCYNYGHYLRSCVDSVLSQPGVEVDVLIVDDASPDGSASVVREIAAADDRVRAICHDRNRGHIATYNEGLSQVDGDYVVLLSADDLLTPSSLARATAVMEQHPEVGLVYGRAVAFSGDDLPPARTTATSWTLWRGRDWLADRCGTGRNPLRSPEAVMRTSVLRAVGGYNPELPHAGDLEMWMRAATVSDVAFVGGADQAYYREHAANMHLTSFQGGDPKGVLVDLAERTACFDNVLGGDPRWRDLHDLSRRTLAREALTYAVRSFEWGKAESWPVDELAAFAADTCPRPALAPLWRALALRRRVGARRSRRHPLFLPGEQVHKVRARVAHRRWQQAGI